MSNIYYMLLRFTVECSVLKLCVMVCCEVQCSAGAVQVQVQCRCSAGAGAVQVQCRCSAGAGAGCTLPSPAHRNI